VTTQDVQGLAPGEAAYGALTDDRGRPVSDFRLYVLPEAVVLEAPRATFDALHAALDRLVIADDVQLAEADGTPACIEGDDVAASLARLAPVRRARGWFVPPAEALADTALAVGWNAQVQASDDLEDPANLAAVPRRREAMLLASRYGGSGFLDWSGPLEGASDDEAIDAREIAAGRPGPPELAEAKVWNELGAMDAVSFTKGCFMGQEILNRVETQGNLQRRLVRLALSGDVAAGSALEDAQGHDAGVVTRAAQGRAFAFARRGAWEQGTRLVARAPGGSAVAVEVL